MSRAATVVWYARPSFLGRAYQTRAAICSLLRVTLHCTALNSGHIQPVVTTRRWYSFNQHATKMINWERGRERNSQDISLDDLCADMLEKLNHTRCARVSDLNKVFDLCVTPEDLKKAEKVLVNFRHGFNLPRASLPITIVRACIRADRPQRMLHYVRNKVQFGVFPSKNVYHILMDALLKCGDAKRALAAFDLLVSDELTPDEMTYHLATKATLSLSLEALKKEEETGTENEHLTEEAESMELELDKTLEYWEKCRQQGPKLATKTMRFICDTLLAHGQDKKARELLDLVQAKDMVPKQSLFNMKIDVAISTSDFSGAIETLNELCNHDNHAWPEVGAPTKGLPRLQNAIEESGQEELKTSLTEVVQRLKNCGRLQMVAQDVDVNEPMSHSNNPIPS